MHDQPKKDLLIEQIINHSENRGRDMGELHILNKQLKGLTIEELKKRKRKQNRS